MSLSPIAGLGVKFVDQVDGVETRLHTSLNTNFQQDDTVAFHAALLTRSLVQKGSRM